MSWPAWLCASHEFWQGRLWRCFLTFFFAKLGEIFSSFLLWPLMNDAQASLL
jgi:hypothetical protein